LASGPPQGRARLEELVGRPVTDTELANLVGAQPGASVEIGRGGSFTVRGANGSYVHTVQMLPPDPSDPRLGLQNNTFEERGNTGAPFPAAILAMQVRQAQALGFSYIGAKSRGGSRDFVELPRLGYDALVDAHLLKETNDGRDVADPTTIAHPPGRMLSDILATRAGRAWWNAEGREPGLAFNLAPGSRSIDTLNRYLRAHHMPEV
jgi:hypothetical protein